LVGILGSESGFYSSLNKSNALKLKGKTKRLLRLKVSPSIHKARGYTRKNMYRIGDKETALLFFLKYWKRIKKIANVPMSGRPATLNKYRYGYICEALGNIIGVHHLFSQRPGSELTPMIL
jgi:hypothetical protein